MKNNNQKKHQAKNRNDKETINKGYHFLLIFCASFDSFWVYYVFSLFLHSFSIENIVFFGGFHRLKPPRCCNYFAS